MILKARAIVRAVNSQRLPWRFDSASACASAATSPWHGDSFGSRHAIRMRRLAAVLPLLSDVFVERPHWSQCRGVGNRSPRRPASPPSRTSAAGHLVRLSSALGSETEFIENRLRVPVEQFLHSCAEPPTHQIKQREPHERGVFGIQFLGRDAMHQLVALLLKAPKDVLDGVEFRLRQCRGLACLQRVGCQPLSWSCRISKCLRSREIGTRILRFPSD
jgi:hypothetical protein